METRNLRDLKISMMEARASALDRAIFERDWPRVIQYSSEVRDLANRLENPLAYNYRVNLDTGQRVRG